jgi:hypothetical protein
MQQPLPLPIALPTLIPTDTNCNQKLSLPSTKTSLKMQQKNVHQQQRNASNPRMVQFPLKLHQILETIDNVDNHTGENDIMSWSRDGNSFIIYDKEKFVNHIIPKYFNKTSTAANSNSTANHVYANPGHGAGMSKFTSFVRQLNLYGFKRTKRSHTMSSPKSSSNKSSTKSNVIIEYYHQLFLRDDPSSCLLIARNSSNSSSASSRLSSVAKKNMKLAAANVNNKSSSAATSSLKKLTPLNNQDLIIMKPQESQQQLGRITPTEASILTKPVLTKCVQHMISSSSASNEATDLTKMFPVTSTTKEVGGESSSIVSLDDEDIAADQLDDDLETIVASNVIANIHEEELPIISECSSVDNDSEDDTHVDADVMEAEFNSLVKGLCSEEDIEDVDEDDTPVANDESLQQEENDVQEQHSKLDKMIIDENFGANLDDLNEVWDILDEHDFCE